MNPWIAKAVVLAATVVMIAIRAPHGRGSRRSKVIKSHRTPLEAILLILAWMGFFVPLIWIASPVFSFAEYPLRRAPLISGVVCFVIGLWLFYRSHADLGTNWSITLEVREHHRLITEGVYRRIRHPMYSALVLYGVAHALVIPNWVAGSSNVVSFAVLFLLRVRPEERMMLEQFGDEYTAYMARTKRLVPGVWCLVVSLLSATTSPVVAQAAFELAPPTGRYQVGTTSWRLIDNSRKETFTGSGEFRQVEVLAWYPTQAPRRGALAPYLREGLSEVRSFALLLRGPQTTFDRLADVRTHAEMDATPAASPDKLPVLVFSLGYTGIPSAYTALLEDLASHGVDVRDTLHLDFSDMAFWAGPLRERGMLGTMPPARASAITGAIVREYFDQELLGQRSRLLAGEPLFPEVTVITFPPPLPAR